MGERRGETGSCWDGEKKEKLRFITGKRKIPGLTGERVFKRGGKGGRRAWQKGRGRRRKT